jgi:hypothetical protein
MIEHKRLHDFISWREKWTGDDVEKALADAGLTGWTFDHWSDGDMQFMHKGPVPFDDLVKLRIAFTPKHMNVMGMVDPNIAPRHKAVLSMVDDTSPPGLEFIPLMVLVNMSWYVNASGEG